MTRVFIETRLSPGDLVYISGVIRDCCEAWPNQYTFNVKCRHPEIFENNPNISDFKYEEADFSTDFRLKTPPSTLASTTTYSDALADILEETINAQISSRQPFGDLYLSERERENTILEEFGITSPYTIVNAGWKYDIPAKNWGVENFKELVERTPERQWVQVGCGSARHELLEGPNVIQIIGQTSIRQLLSLIYHSSCVLTPPSLSMAVADALKVPSVVLAGGRECGQWHHRSAGYLETGGLHCNKPEGCWNRLLRIDRNGKSAHMCTSPAMCGEERIAKCMSRISVATVKEAVENFESPSVKERQKTFTPPNIIAPTHKQLKSLTVRVPPGIGDVGWNFQKLQDNVEELHVEISGEKPRRSLEFIGMIDGVSSVKYVDGLKYRNILENCVPGDCDISKYDGQDVSLQANTWLEAGRHIKDFLPTLTTKYDLRFNVPPKQREVAVRDMEEDSFRIGIYPSKHSSVEAWGGPSPKEWIEEMKKLDKVFHPTFYLIGASFDEDYVSLIAKLCEKEGLRYVNTVGYEIGSTIVMIENLNLLLSFPSGIGILGSYAKTPTVMMMPKHLRDMWYSWLERSTTFIHLDLRQFGRVTQHINNLDLL